MLETLGWGPAVNKKLWSRWLKAVDKRCRNVAPAELVTTEPAQTSSAATASAAKPHPFSSPICYRGHRLRSFRYMRVLLRVHHEDGDGHKWLREVRCRVSDRRSLVGLRMFDNAATWFEEE